MLLDLRKEFDAILKDFGSDVIILHLDRRFKCPACWSSTTREPSSDCSICLGTGYAFSAIKVKARRVQMPVSSNAVPSFVGTTLSPQEGGPVPQSYDTEGFYLPHNASISDGDYILIASWSNGVPVRIERVYQIVRSDKILGFNGRPEYTYALGMFRAFDVPRLNKMLPRIKEGLRNGR